MYCYSNGEQLVEQTLPSTEITLQTGYVYVFLHETSTYYEFIIIGGDGNTYSTTLLPYVDRMFVNPTSTGSFNRTVQFYNNNDELVMNITDSAQAAWGVDTAFFKTCYEVVF